MPFCLGIYWTDYTFVTGLVWFCTSVSNSKPDNKNSKKYENGLYENKRLSSLAEVAGD